MKNYYLIPSEIADREISPGVFVKIQCPKYLRFLKVNYSGSIDKKRGYYIALVQSNFEDEFIKLEKNNDVVKLDGGIRAKNKVKNILKKNIQGDEVNELIKLINPSLDKSQLRIFE